MARSAIIRNGVSVQTRLADQLIPVHGDRVQLQQVVVNLILNAVEAMGSVETGARELSIRTEQDRTGVLVVVRDSGPGIDRGSSRARFRGILHHEGRRNGNGTVDLPIDHRRAWGPAVGGGERTLRRNISVHLARRAREIMIFILAYRIREPREDIVLDAPHRPACEGNRQLRRSWLGPDQHRWDRPSRGLSELGALHRRGCW